MVSDLENVLNQRQEDYGDPRLNFWKIGRMWGALLGIEDIAPHEVALMMDALKTVRLFANPQHEDSWVDKLGYITHGKEMVTDESGINRCKCGAWLDLKMTCVVCTLIDERLDPKGEQK